MIFTSLTAADDFGLLQSDSFSTVTHSEWTRPNNASNGSNARNQIFGYSKSAEKMAVE